MRSVALISDEPVSSRHADAVAPAADGPRPTAETVSTPRLTLPWLIRLRWVALLAQTAVVFLGSGSGWLPFPGAVLFLIGVGVLSNAGLLLLARRPVLAGSKGLLGGTLLADVLLLTAVLALTGGPSNPFTMGYLVYVTLAAVTLGAAWTWLIVAIAIGGYASLFVWQVPISEHAAHSVGLPSHLAGMWLAFATSAAAIAFFVTGVTRTLARRERELAQVRQVAIRHERLASLTTLAAGAAHELATPLASIAVAAKELERTSEGMGIADISQDARLIRAQVERCRMILDQMSGRLGQSWHESARVVRVSEVVDLVRGSLDDARAARLEVDSPTALEFVTARAGLAQALLNLVRNAFDASPIDGRVWLEVRPDDRFLHFIVRDRGPGMSSEVLARAGEPFFTTKPPGAGYGLGLFLVRLFAEGQGGTLEIDSEPGQGTTVLLELPRESRP